MDFDWSKPMIIDWSGRSGPLIKEEDIKNSVIKRILRNQYYAPFCEREYIRVKPWWSPQDPFGTNSGNNHRNRNDMFIPGLHPVPAYPQLSTLSRQQHQHGLRVLAAKQDNMHLRDCPQPSQKDYHVFEEIQALYIKEQKEYIKWAKQAWINGDCIRALRPKPIIEKVYEAEFKMKTNEIQSLPLNYTLAAQIPLETKNYAFELQHKKNLIDVDVRDLPIIDYPEEMESNFSILKACAVPEPCAKHPCKFIIPHEDSVSVLPLTEVHRELAQYAIDNGASFIASENSLHCLQQTERSWKISVSVVEVISPEGDLKNVIVLGNEFEVQKDCATQRTYRAYRHLLRHRFAPLSGQHKTQTPSQTTAPLKPTSTPQVIEEPIAPRFEYLDDDLAVSSDEDYDRLQIDDEEPKSKPDRLVIADCIDKPDKEPVIDKCTSEPNNEYDIDECTGEPNNESDIDEFTGELSNESDGEPDRLMINDNVYDTTPQPFQASSAPNYSNDTCEAVPSYSNIIRESSYNNTSEVCILPETKIPNHSNYTSKSSYSINRDLIHRTDKAGKNTFISKPSYSNDTSDSCDSESDNAKLRISEYCNNTRKSDCDIPNTDKPWNRLFKTNKDADLRLFESNEDAAPILFKTKKDAELSFLETNKEEKFIKPNMSEAKTSKPMLCSNEPMSTVHVGPKKLGSVKLYRAPVKPNMSEGKASEPSEACLNEPMTSGTICDVSSQKTFKVCTKNLSPNKPYTGAVRTLSISKAKTYNITGLFNEQNIIKVTPTNSTLKQTRKRSATGTNNTDVTMVNSPITAEETSEVIPKQLIPLKPERMQNMIKTDAIEIAEVNEPIAIKKTSGVSPIKSPLKLCIKKRSSDPSPPKISARKLRSASAMRKLSICEAEANSSQATDSGIKPISNQTATEPSSNGRAIKLSEQMSKDHGYCMFDPENPRPRKTGLRKLSEMEHDYCKFQEPTSYISVERSDSNQLSPGSNSSSPGRLMIHDVSSKHIKPTREPGVRRLSFNETISTKPIKTETLSFDKPATESNRGIRNVRTNKITTTNGVTGNTAKMSLSDLFGDESDSDEPICRNSDRTMTFNAKRGNNISVFSDLGSTRIKTEISDINNINNLNSNEAITKDESNCTNHNTRKSSCRNATSEEPSNKEKNPLKPCLRQSNFDSSPRNSKRTLSFSDPEFEISFSEPDSVEPIAGFDDGVAVPCANQPKSTKKKQKGILSCTYGLRSRSKAKPVTIEKKPKTKQTYVKEENSRKTIKSIRNTDNTTPNRSRDVDASDDSDYLEFSRCISTSSNSKMHSPKTNIVQIKTENVGLRKSQRLFSRLNAEDSYDSHTNEKEIAKTNAKDISTENTVGFRRSRRLSVRSNTKENVQPKTNKTKCKTNGKSLVSNSFYKISKKGQRRKSLPANIFSNTDIIYKILRSNSVTNLNEITTKRKESLSTKSATSLNTKDTSKSTELSERTKRYFLRSFNSETDQSEGDISERTKRYIRPMSSDSETGRPDTELQRTKKYTRHPKLTSPYARKTNISKTVACSNSRSIEHKEKISERTKRHIRRSMSLSYSSCEETNQPHPTRTKKTKRQAVEIKTEIDLTNPEMGQSTTNGNDSTIETCQVKIILHEETSDNMDETETLEILHFSKINEEHLSETEDVLIDSQHITLDTTNASRVANPERTMPRGLDFANTNGTDLTESNRSRKLSICYTSDSSDYFDSNEIEDLNLFHFTATNVTDSEEESDINDSELVVNSQLEEDLDTETGEFLIVEKEHQSVENVGISGTANELDQPVKSQTEIVEPNEFERIETRETLKAMNNETNQLYRDRKKNSPKGKSGDLNYNHETLDKTALSKEAIDKIIGVNNCACKGTLFETPPPRSFKKWQVRNTTSNVTFDLIVHSSHKVRKGTQEVLLEPIVEYQPELGGTKQSAGKIRSLALSLMLRESAGLMNVRVDHESGNIILVDAMSSDQFIERHGDHSGAVADALHTACNQLRFLMPGQYVLAHDSCHGINAMLYTTKGVLLSGRAQTLSLRTDNINMSDAEDAIFAKIPQELGLVLLPYHKHRSILPLCFTPYKSQVREDKKTAAAAALARARHPPQAIQWPKKKKKSKKTRQGRQANTTQ